MNDTNIYFELPDLLHLQKTVNKELQKVRKWLESNRLVLNIYKTNFVIFYSAGKEICDNKRSTEKIMFQFLRCFT